MRWRHIHIILCLLLVAFVAQAQTRIFTERKLHTHHNSQRKISASGLRTTQYDGIHHLLGIYADGGYSTFINNVGVNKVLPFGYTAGAGLLYNYNKERFLLQTGIGFRWQQVTDTVAPLTLWHRQTPDSWGKLYDLRHDFYGRFDKASTLYLQVPLLVGGYVYGRLYLLGGVKFNMALYGFSDVSATCTTTGYYLDASGQSYYIGPQGQMDNHGLRRDVPLQRHSGMIDWGLDVLGEFEIGYEFPFNDRGRTDYMKSKMEKDIRLRIALFAEAGVLNICPRKHNPLYVVPDTREQGLYDFDTYSLPHVFMSEAASGASVHNLFAGLRVSFFFFGYQSKEKCLLCGPRRKEKVWRQQ